MEKRKRKLNLIGLLMGIVIFLTTFIMGFIFMKASYQEGYKYAIKEQSQIVNIKDQNIEKLTEQNTRLQTHIYKQDYRIGQCKPLEIAKNFAETHTYDRQYYNCKNFTIDYLRDLSNNNYQGLYVHLKSQSINHAVACVMIEPQTGEFIIDKWDCKIAECTRND